MEQIIVVIQQLIITAGGWGVFGASVLEEIFSPIPASLVQTTAGIFIMGGTAFSLGGFLKLLFLVSLPAGIGVSIGSLPYVWAMRRYGTVGIEKYGKYIGVTKTDLEQLEKKTHTTYWDDVAFVGMRAFPVIPSVMLALYAGMVRMNYVRYCILSTIGVFIRATGLGLVGWLIGTTASSITSIVNYGEQLGLVIVALAILWYIYKYYTNKRAV